MKKIFLSKKVFTSVDDEDYAYLTQWKWRLKQGYAVRSVNMGRVNGKQQTKTVMMHRVIMKTPDGLETDHRDLDKLNNQKHNLRVCTTAQNRQNRGAQINNKTGKKGVCRNGKKWMANIGFQGKQKYLGTFDTIEEASNAFNQAALLLHGEFSNTNKESI